MSRLTIDEPPDNQAAMSSDENKALYQDFCMRNKHLKRGSLEFKNTLMSDPYFNALRLKFGYAITCHKAQGSEWNQVLVKCKTNQSQLSAGYFRWFYTAITRTAQKLYLLDPPNIKLGSGIKMVPAPGIGFPVELTKDESSAMVGARAQLAVEAPVKVNMEMPLKSVLTMVAAHDASSNTFGIPVSRQFLLALLGRVRELIKDTDICIDVIGHNQYQEAYFFKRGDDFSRVNIVYNGREKVVSLTATQPTALAADVIGLLEPLKGVPVANSAAVSLTQFSFEEDFLNELHHRLMPLAEKRGMAIQNVARLPWNLRYKFTRGSEVAVYDIFFDGKKRFNKCQPVITACSPGSLVRDVGVMLTDELSA